MGKKTRVPIHIRGSKEEDPVPEEDVPPVAEAVPPASEEEMVRPKEREEPTAKPGDESEELEIWRDRALRLQAEMENFRKRQRRWAEDVMEADRHRLLRAFLPVGDDLERALDPDIDSLEGLREGVELTHRTFHQILRQEGVEPVDAEGEEFDPSVHEAVGHVPHEEAGVEPDKIVHVVRRGYRLGERLLRPARVIIAS